MSDPSKGVPDPAVPNSLLPGPQALTDGYTTAFTWAAALLVAGALVSAVLIKATKEDLPTDADAMVHVG